MQPPGADEGTAATSAGAEPPEAVDGAATDGDAATRPHLDSGAAAVSVRNLTKTYGDDVRAVDGVSFDVEPGTVVGLLGPNGAGKTTLIKSVLGLVLPDAGAVDIDGVDVYADTREAYRHVGAMLEGARNVYWRLTVRENLRFFAALGDVDPAKARERGEELLDRLDLQEKADTPVNDLSRGMKQKTALACTLSRGVPVVFLDEPTLGLDVESSLSLRRELRRLAEDESTTVVLSSHDMGVIETVCDRVVVLSEGRVVADDSVAALKALFRTQRYRVVVDGRIDDRLDARLRREYEVIRSEPVGDTTHLELAVESGRELHAALGAVLDAGHEVASVDAADPDFEEVFLRLTERDAAPVTDAPVGDDPEGGADAANGADTGVRPGSGANSGADVGADR
ncbi:ABC transporter ATP-binding protein [Halobium salinum]|uniref:ABC transporter ATP-binding protein n=1 Tax=Halobium salinum TaxID=1364940 RepID=A0ABD5PHQ6_9EURY|nr:ABC transporter ATP-binding protein [Halobium salinum]